MNGVIIFKTSRCKHKGIIKAVRKNPDRRLSIRVGDSYNETERKLRMLVKASWMTRLQTREDQGLTNNWVHINNNSLLTIYDDGMGKIKNRTILSTYPNHPEAPIGMCTTVNKCESRMDFMNELERIRNNPLYQVTNHFETTDDEYKVKDISEFSVCYIGQKLNYEIEFNEIHPHPPIGLTGTSYYIVARQYAKDYYTLGEEEQERASQRWLRENGR